jgi:putative flippase GtrA
MFPKIVVSNQLIKYGLVGIISNSIGYLIYFILTYLWISPQVAITILYFIGALIGFFGNKNFTFSHQGSQLTAGIRYLITHFIGYLFNLFILFIGVNQFGYPHQIVQIFAILIVAVFLFLSFKYFVFTDAKKFANGSQE